jgi:hypothetical protein
MLKGTKHTARTRRKIAAANRGRVTPQETRDKIRATHLRRSLAAESFLLDEEGKPPLTRAEQEARAGARLDLEETLLLLEREFAA